MAVESDPGSGVLSWIWTLILALESHLGFRIISWLWNALDFYPGSGSRMKISGNLPGLVSCCKLGAGGRGRSPYDKYRFLRLEEMSKSEFSAWRQRLALNTTVSRVLSAPRIQCCTRMPRSSELRSIALTSSETTASGCKPPLTEAPTILDAQAKAGSLG
jgi:hypothetical protein